MTTSGAASINASQSELSKSELSKGELTQNEMAQDFERRLQPESNQALKDVFKANRAVQDSEGIKQNTVDSSANEIVSQTKVASNDPKIEIIGQSHTFDATVEQKMSPSVTNAVSNNAISNTETNSLEASSEQASYTSQKKLKDLMQEFKSLLEDYQQQTLMLAKNFANISESKTKSQLEADQNPDQHSKQNSDQNSRQNLDLSAIGNVVVQQKDLDGYESGLAQLTQTLHTMESELEASLRKAEYYELSRKDLEAAHLEMLERLANTSETRCDPISDLTKSETANSAANLSDLSKGKHLLSKGKHLDRVGKLCAQIAETLGCSQEFIDKIASSARLHDIGKLAIPDSILQKPDRLDADEYATMKMHTIHGAEMLANNSSEIVQMAQRIALSHHENWDGTGYPYQLQREEIALEGRIAAVADVYDALISTRIYKEAWPKEKAIEQIKSRSGTKFDPTIVEAFLKIVA